MAAALSVAGLAMLVVTWFALHSHRPAFRFDARPPDGGGILDWNLFVALIIASGVITITATRIAARTPAGLGLVIVLSFAAALRIVASGEPPALSSDVYRYVWDGRVQGAGINPFRYVPGDPELAPLRDPVIFPKIDRSDRPTIYPPVAQFFFLTVTRMGDSVTAMRLALIGCEIVTLWLLIDLLRLLGKPPALAVAYAWHPLTVWETANNGHIEALMVALVMVGVWLLLRHRRLAAGLAIALAALVKPYAAVALPACWRPWDWRLPAATVAVVVACYLPYLGVGSGALGFLSEYLNEEGFRDAQGLWPALVARTLFGSVPWLVPLYLMLAMAMTGFFALRASFRPAASPDAIIGDVLNLILCALFFLSPNHPWYYLMLVPFIPLGGGAPAWVLSIGGFTLYLDYANSDMIDIVWKGALNVAFLIALLTPRLRVGISKL
jgi:hypothetical protein